MPSWRRLPSQAKEFMKKVDRLDSRKISESNRDEIEQMFDEINEMLDKIQSEQNEHTE